MSFLPALRVLPRATTTTTSSLFNRSFSASASHKVAKMTIVGRLAADPEIVTLSSGEEMAKYALGTNRGQGDSRQTSWWKVVCFLGADSKLKERLASMPKGALMYVEGDASMRKFEREPGKVENALNIVQKRMEVLQRPDPGRRQSEDSSQQTPEE